MNKFTGPTKVPSYEPKPKSTTSQQFSGSSYTSSTGAGQSTTTTTRSSTSYSMTYSSLPKPQEPPVNSTAYFEMLQQASGGNTSSNIQQPVAPPHIQGPAPGFGALRDRFKTGSVSENTPNPIQDIRRQQQQQQSNTGLSSLRDQYVNRATESSQHQEESFSQRIQSVSQSFGSTNQSQQQLQDQQTPPAPPPTPQMPQQEELQVQSQSVDDQPASSEGAVADGSSSSGASSLEKDATVTATATTS